MGFFDVWSHDKIESDGKKNSCVNRTSALV